MEKLQDEAERKRPAVRRWPARPARAASAVAVLAILVALAAFFFSQIAFFLSPAPAPELPTRVEAPAGARPQPVPRPIPPSLPTDRAPAGTPTVDFRSEVVAGTSGRPPLPGELLGRRESVRIVHRQAPGGGGGGGGSGSGGGGGNPAAVERLPHQITWNYWLGKHVDSPMPEVHAAPLRIGETRQLVFRLSSVDLALSIPALKTLASAPELLIAVQSALADSARPVLRLDVLVQSVDAQRIRLGGNGSRIPMVIDLDAMRATLARGELDIAPGVRPTEAALRAAMIAQFAIELTPLAAGKHDLGIVILDTETGFPLQTMIAEIEVGKAWPASVAARANGRVPVDAGGPPYDLSLFLFDLASVERAVTVRKLHAQLYFRDSATGARAVLAWRTDTTLRGLEDATKTFRTTVGSLKSGRELLKAGRAFGRLIFDPPSAEGVCVEEANCNAARAARNVIAAAARYGPERLPPSMLVRFVHTGPAAGQPFESPVVPVGAMGVVADGQTQPVYLGERFALALLLADQEFETLESCPRQWYVALPRDEDHLPTAKGDPLAAALAGLRGVIGKLEEGKYLHRQSRDLSELSGWLDRRDDRGSFVFSYLGHHGDGRLFLDPDSTGIAAGDMQRVFERASIAILNACDSALPWITDGNPIGKLSEKRVDSTIATTSRISGELAAAYVDCLHAVLADPRALTIGQAHALATQCLSSEKDSKRWQRQYEFQGAALKYILIGNPHQRICSPYTGASP